MPEARFSIAKRVFYYLALKATADLSTNLRAE